MGRPESEGGGPESPVIQVGIVSWGIIWYMDPRFPSVFTRVSEVSHSCYCPLVKSFLTQFDVFVCQVADWVKETVCERTGELCRSSKAGKTSKTKKTYPNCAKVPTYAPTVTPQPITPFPTYAPTVTAPPITPYPTYLWPTWMPTTSEGM